MKIKFHLLVIRTGLCISSCMVWLGSGVGSRETRSQKSKTSMLHAASCESPSGRRSPRLIARTSLQRQCDGHAGIFIYPSSCLWLYRRDTAAVLTFGLWLASLSSHLRPLAGALRVVPHPRCACLNLWCNLSVINPIRPVFFLVSKNDPHRPPLFFF